MSSKTRKPVLLALLALVALFAFGGLAWLGYRWAMDEQLARLEEFDGAPERDHDEKRGDWIAAEEGDSFYEGDGARTSEDEVAHFLLFNGSRLQLQPSSQVRFTRGTEGQEFGLDVELGEVDLVTTQEGMLIGSEFGDIAIESNSRIALRKKDGRLALQVEIGALTVLKEDRELKAGESIELEIGGLVFEEETEPAEEATDEEEVIEEEDEPFEVFDAVEARDLLVSTGETATIHDPAPPTAVGFAGSEDCEEGTLILSGKQKGASRSAVNLSFGPGVHSYRVACVEAPEKIIAKGMVRIVKDSGSRPLPRYTPKADVSTDGRSYRLVYQNRLPEIRVHWNSAPQEGPFSLVVDGRSIQSRSSSYVLRSGSLRAGRHTLQFKAATDPPRSSRKTVVEVVYDSQAPKARLSKASTGDYENGGGATVKGQALPGWSVEVEGEALELDKAGQFEAPHDGEGTMAVRFSHPKRGVHYYLRRVPQSL